MESVTGRVHHTSDLRVSGGVSAEGPRAGEGCCRAVDEGFCEQGVVSRSGGNIYGNHLVLLDILFHRIYKLLRMGASGPAEGPA